MKKKPLLIAIKARLSEDFPLERSGIYQLWKTIQELEYGNVKITYFDKINYSRSKNRIVLQVLKNGVYDVTETSLDDYTKVKVIDKTTKLMLCHEKIDQIPYKGYNWGYDNYFSVKVMEWFNIPTGQDNVHAPDELCAIYRIIRFIINPEHKDTSIVKIMKEFLTMEKHPESKKVGEDHYVNICKVIPFIDSVMRLLEYRKEFSTQAISDMIGEYVQHDVLFKLRYIPRALFIAYYANKALLYKSENNNIMFTGLEIKREIEKYGAHIFVTGVSLPSYPYDFANEVIPKVMKSLLKDEKITYEDVVYLTLSGTDSMYSAKHFSNNIEYRLVPKPGLDKPTYLPITKDTTVNWIV